MFVICNECKSLLALFYWLTKDGAVQLPVSMDEIRVLDTSCLEIEYDIFHLDVSTTITIEDWLLRFYKTPYYYLDPYKIKIREAILQNRLNSIYQCEHLKNIYKPDKEFVNFNPNDFPDIKC